MINHDTIIISDSNENGFRCIEAACGKVHAVICILSHGISVCILSNKFRQNLCGKIFLNMEEATNHYKSQEMKNILGLV